MPRILIRHAIFMLALPVLTAQTTYAQVSDGDVVFPSQQGGQANEQAWQRQTQAFRQGQGIATMPQRAIPAQPTGHHHLHSHANNRYAANPQLVAGAVVDGGVAGAALYPCPQPHIPTNVGTTVITNQALAPHEMLYAHKYKALYPPFYHKTTRTWCLIPGKLHRTEKRVLTGTMVEVDYKSYISPFSLYCPPIGFRY